MHQTHEESGVIQCQTASSHSAEWHVPILCRQQHAPMREQR